MATGTPKEVTLKALGLYTYPNQVSAPEGALNIALDVVVDRPGVIQNRAGYGTIAYTTAAGGFAFPRTTSPGGLVYMDAVSVTTPGGVPHITSNGGAYVTDSTLSSTATSLSLASSGFITSAFRANLNDYLQLGDANHSSKLTHRYSYLGGVGRSAGMPVCPTPADYIGNPTFGGGGATLPAYGLPLTGQPAFGLAASTVLATGGAVAYRALLATKDYNGNLVRGVPSGRLELFKTAVYTYGIVCPIPTGGSGRNAAAGDIWQLYRSETSSTASVTAGTASPSDDMRLVYEYILTATDITRGYVTLANEVCPDALRGDALYTNDTQEGALQANYLPPASQFGISHKGVAWYGGGSSTKGSSLVLTVLGVAGWIAGTTTVTVGSSTYTAAAAESWPGKTFQLFATGSPTLDTANTLRSLARVVAYDGTANGSTTCTYVTSPSSAAQQLLFKYGGQGASSSPATISSNAPAGTISPTAATLALTAYGKNNWLYHSKPNQPEAVPDVNYVPIGSPDAYIRGLASLRDSLFVFKEDGLFRVTGTTAYDIRIELFDATVKMVAGQDRSIATAGNQIFAMTNQGVVSITESGVSIIDRAIKDVTYKYSSLVNDFNGIQFPCIGSASDVGGKYFLFLQDQTTTSQLGYCYNYINNAWTMLSLPGSNFFATAAGSAAIFPSGAGEKLIIADGTTTVRTLAAGDPYPTGVASCSFSYCVSDVDSPGLLTRFYDITVVLTGSTGMTSLTFAFSSDSGAAPENVTVSVPSAQVSCKVAVPRSHSYCSQLNFTVTSQASTCKMMVSSVVIGYSTASDRVPGVRS